MTSHSLRLHAEPFNAIASGEKTIESRLYDDKRQQIEIGDELIFINRANTEQTIKVRVVGLLLYETFLDLFSHNDPAEFGGKSVEELNDNIKEFYSFDEQRKNGVVGIKFERQ